MKGKKVDSTRKSKKRAMDWSAEDRDNEGSQQMRKESGVVGKTVNSKEKFYNFENDEIVDSDQDVFEL